MHEPTLRLPKVDVLDYTGVSFAYEVTTFRPSHLQQAFGLLGHVARLKMHSVIVVRLLEEGLIDRKVERDELWSGLYLMGKRIDVRGGPSIDRGNGTFVTMVERDVLNGPDSDMPLCTHVEAVHVLTREY